MEQGRRGMVVTTASEEDENARNRDRHSWDRRAGSADPAGPVLGSAGVTSGPDGHGANLWFLAPEERGNAGTRIDRRRDDGRAWTEGNRAVALIHGARYFARLHDCLCSLGTGDLVCFTDWRGDADERLRCPGTEVGMVLANLARAGVSVRGLVWGW